VGDYFYVLLVLKRARLSDCFHSWAYNKNNSCHSISCSLVFSRRPTYLDHSLGCSGLRSYSYNDWTNFVGVFLRYITAIDVFVWACMLVWECGCCGCWWNAYVVMNVDECAVMECVRWVMSCLRLNELAWCSEYSSQWYFLEQEISKRQWIIVGILNTTICCNWATIQRSSWMMARQN